ncbi:hypothetical protein [Paenibacillus sp. UNC499MF]|uniref:hypothetical protein n=1 Tax=Paenibacillus sp. UNC499MF TaxID=1502751 RepID=UPI0021563CFA|nr:hypothetical protein [Paenibacillus sp. UNC499MF]
METRHNQERLYWLLQKMITLASSGTKWVTYKAINIKTDFVVNIKRGVYDAGYNFAGLANCIGVIRGLSVVSNILWLEAPEKENAASAAEIIRSSGSGA